MKTRPRFDDGAGVEVRRWEEDGGPARETQARGRAPARRPWARLGFVVLVLFWLWALWTVAAIADRAVVGAGYPPWSAAPP